MKCSKILAYQVDGRFRLCESHAVVTLHTAKGDTHACAAHEEAIRDECHYSDNPVTGMRSLLVRA